LFISKKSPDNELEDESSVVEQSKLYTNNGQLVPTQPKFITGGETLRHIVDKIYENKDLVNEFIHKKHQGQIDLSLLVRKKYNP
jgi:hypothetical protein